MRGDLPRSEYVPIDCAMDNGVSDLNAPVDEPAATYRKGGWLTFCTQYIARHFSVYT